MCNTFKLIVCRNPDIINGTQVIYLAQKGLYLLYNILLFFLI